MRGAAAANCKAQREGRGALKSGHEGATLLLRRQSTELVLSDHRRVLGLEEVVIEDVPHGKACGCEVTKPLLRVWLEELVKQVAGLRVRRSR